MSVLILCVVVLVCAGAEPHQGDRARDGGGGGGGGGGLLLLLLGRRPARPARSAD